MSQAQAAKDELRWLFLDLNSYFASVEQQLNPSLRGRPVAVVAVMTDSTCAIAASREAKAFGVSTGTRIGEAKRLCPGLELIVADHSRYVEFHERIKQEVTRHFPIEVVASIDEMGLLLDPPHQAPHRAVDLAKRIKHGLRQRVGECITCSIGIAPNRYLAKVASDIEKPDGLTILNLRDLPGKISHWKLTSLFGIGRRMEPRLRSLGITTVERLWEAGPQQLEQAWGGVAGRRFWQQLHGGELGEFAQQSRSIGHSHVLAPELRKPPEALIVARRMLTKAASRMRREGCRCASLTLSVRGEQEQRSDVACRLTAPANDNFSLMAALERLWPKAMDEMQWARARKVGVTLTDLTAMDAPQQLSLFADESVADEETTRRRERLSAAMDAINQRFGRDSIAMGFLPNAVHGFSGTKIAFTRIPSSEEFHE